MNHLFYFILFAYILPLNNLYANCDTTTFRWECDIPAKLSAKPYATSMVRCGGALAYVTYNEYEQLMRNQRDNINMVLKINGEYIDGPCIPIQH